MENKIKQRRKELGISQHQLAKKLGTDQSIISRWENDIMEPLVFNAICLAKALETTVEELFSP